MTAPVVRLQMPAGDAFVAALVDAAHKYASRRNLGANGAEAFVRLVQLSLEAANSTAPATLELTVTESASRVDAVIRGIESTRSIAPDARTRLGVAARSPLTIADDPVSIAFSTELG